MAISTTFLCNNIMPPKVIIEGFWRSMPDDSSSSLPFPEPTQTTIDQNFLTKLTDVEKKISQVSVGLEVYKIGTGALIYMGQSYCRLCNLDSNGSMTFVYNNDDYMVMWPQGYLHYLENHNVQPSEAFVAFINWASQLPSISGDPERQSEFFKVLNSTKTGAKLNDKEFMKKYDAFIESRSKAN